MATTDNSSLQPTPGGTVTPLMLARAIIRRAQITTNVAMPGTVLEWTPPVEAGPESKPAMVRVRPDFKYARAIDNADSAAPGEEVREHPAFGLIAVGVLPEIPNVPVHYPGPSGMMATGPVQIGECGLLVFADRSIDDWIQDGGPAEWALRHQRHNLTDAIFQPGLRYGTVAQSVDQNLYFIGREDRTAGMGIDATTRDLTVSTEGPNATVDAATQIKLGANATLGVARLNDNVTASAAFTTFMTQVVTALTTIAAAVPVPIVPPVIPAGPIGAISSASTKVKSE